MHLACSIGKSFTICLVSGREWKGMEEKKKVEEKRERKYVFRCKWKDKLMKQNIKDGVLSSSCDLAWSKIKTTTIQFLLIADLNSTY